MVDDGHDADGHTVSVFHRRVVVQRNVAEPIPKRHLERMGCTTCKDMAGEDDYLVEQNLYLVVLRRRRVIVNVELYAMQNCGGMLDGSDEYDRRIRYGMWLNEMANIPFNMTAASITCFLVCHHMCVSRRWSSIFTSHIPPSAVACLICGFKRSRGTCVDSGGLGRSRFALLNQVDAHPTPSPCIIPTKFKSITSVTSLPEVASMVNKTTAR